jgi:hypothetical protein
MASSVVTPLSQMRLAALLLHFQRGDFTTFSHACELAFGGDLSSGPYFRASVLLAAQICGLCEVSTESGAIKWWVAHDGDVTLHSGKSKQIGISPEWFRAHEASLVPLIKDSDDRPLMLGRHMRPSEAGSVPSLFAARLDSVLPPFRDIEDQLCVRAQFSDIVEDRVEAYRPDTGKWESILLSALKGPHLIRARREFSGFTLYVQHRELGVRWRITQPEWGFIVAFFLLPWQLSDLLKVESDGNVRVRREARLPALILRFLFSGADELCVGAWLTFKRVQGPVLAGVLGFLSQAGERS